MSHKHNKPGISPSSLATSSTSQKSHSEDQKSNIKEAEKRYQIMISTLKEAELKEKEIERLKSAKSEQDKSEFIKQLGDKYDQNKTDASGGPGQTKKNVLKAPNELLEEFLVYVMDKQWHDALKLCGFILMYEPQNTIAKEYLPILERKVEEIDSRGDSTSGSEDSNSDSYSDDSESTSDDSGTDSDTSESENETKAKKCLEKIEEKDDNDDIEIPPSFATKKVTKSATASKDLNSKNNAKKPNTSKSGNNKLNFK